VKVNWRLSIDYLLCTFLLRRTRVKGIAILEVLVSVNRICKVFLLCDVLLAMQVPVFFVNMQTTINHQLREFFNMKSVCQYLGIGG